MQRYKIKGFTLFGTGLGFKETLLIKHKKT